MDTFRDISIVKYGRALSSRPEGREAALACLAYSLPKPPPAELMLDFQDVVVLTPTWLAEFTKTLHEQGVRRFSYKNTENASVSATIDFLSQI
jgi:hypothetical protein